MSIFSVFASFSGCSFSTPGALFPSSTGGTPPQRYLSSPFSEQEINHFLELAIRPKFNNRVVRWGHNVRIHLLGTPSAQDRRTVDETIALFNTYSGEVQFELNSLAPHVHISFAPQDSFSDYVPFLQNEQSELAGAVGICGVRAGLLSMPKKSQIVIDTRRNQAQRSATIRHEMMHMLGFGHSRRKTSVMYPTSAGSPRFSELDQVAIEILFSQDIHPHMNAEEVRRVLRTSGAL